MAALSPFLTYAKGPPTTRFVTPSINRASEEVLNALLVPLTATVIRAAGLKFTQIIRASAEATTTTTALLSCSCSLLLLPSPAPFSCSLGLLPSPAPSDWLGIQAADDMGSVYLSNGQLVEGDLFRITTRLWRHVHDDQTGRTSSSIRPSLKRIVQLVQGHPLRIGRGCDVSFNITRALHCRFGNHTYGPACRLRLRRIYLHTCNTNSPTVFH